jgi:hypothetical protein
VVHGSSHWPDFVEDMALVCGHEVELEQEGSEPLKAAGDDEAAEVGGALLAWMKQADATQAAARIGSAAQGPSVVVCGTRHIGPQFDSYDITDDVRLLTEAEADTLDALGPGVETIGDVAEFRGVTPQAAGEVLNKLVDRGLVEKEEYALENGQHGYEGSGYTYYIPEPSNRWDRHAAPLAEFGQTDGSVADVEPQKALDEYTAAG